MKIINVVNCEKYPINDIASARGRLFIENVQLSLAHDGCCTLDNFVIPEALSTMAEQAREIIHLAYPGPAQATPYFFNYRLGEDMVVDDNHPLRRTSKRNLSQVAADLIPSSHLLKTLYHAPEMTAFLSAVRKFPVYLNCDRYQSLNISVMGQGGCQQWHFDGGNMVTTLLLQSPESGGEFEYAPNIRSDQDENFEEVRKVMDGTSGRVKKLKLSAGTLSLFQGHYSLHRVTEVKGEIQRLQAILGYTTKPDFVGSLESSILHYGPRVAELESASTISE